ncbi:thioesterase family protein [Marimonas lutisalis]|uniref:thioesterase family protein n=1 Tax=Marimonas lutisalis TaxID=2545756 RepID=UPI0010F96C4C|nr:thioesterase family protein [Marimonas lutisalis]
MTKDFAKPFVSTPMTVEPEWIDYNGHLNMAFYNVLMDRGVDQIWEELGFGPEYRARTGCTTFSAEYHMRYVREIHEGDKVVVTFQLLDHTPKSFHFYQELIHEEGWISATGEGLSLHVDQSGPKVVPMPPDIQANLEALMAAHRDMPVPAHVGHPIGIRRK